MVKKIVEDCAALPGKIEKVGEQIKRYSSSLRPEISFSVTHTEWKAAVGVVPTDAGG